MKQIWRRLFFLVHRSQLDRDLAEEMRLHAEMKVLDNRCEGMTAEEARYAAQRQLGNLTRQQEESRQSWGFPFLESIVQDVRYGIRGLQNAPGFTMIALVTLALGIGATTAIFSVVNSVLLRPLPYKDSTRLVNLWTVTPLFPDFRMGQSIPNLNDIRARSHSFEDIAAYMYGRTALTGNGDPEQLKSASVTASYFSVFSTPPILGRAMTAEDEQGKNGNVVWLSNGLWQRRYAGDRGIVGQSISLDQKLYVVAGILPDSLNHLNAELWKPLVIDADHRQKRQEWLYFAVAKLRRDVSGDQAQTELNSISAQIAAENPKEAEGIHFSLKLLQAEAVAEDSRRLLFVLLAAVGFLLLIACANVSNLVLSRSTQRQREIAVRAALGASRLRILRQLLIESLLLALAGGFLGLTVAIAGVRAFRMFAPQNFARINEVSVSPIMMAIAFLVACITGVLCGMAPAVHASRSDLNLTIKDSTQGHTGKDRFSLRNILAVTEVSLALVLLTGAALMAQSIVRQLHVDTGFRTEHILTAKLQLNLTNYQKPDSQGQFIQRLLDVLRAQPGLGSAGMSSVSMLETTSLMSFDPNILGINEKSTNLQVRAVTPGFLETMGIPLTAGRMFSDHDAQSAPKTMIVNEAMVQHFFAGKNPVGRTLRLDAESKDLYEIIGVVGDTRDIRPGLQARPQIYLSMLQDPFASLYLVVRSQSDMASLVPQLQRSVWSVDKNLPLSDVKSMADVMSATVSEPRFHTWLLSAFAGVGLVLTLIGIYGVISYSVSQRTHEMGIRIALGARPQGVLRLVIKQGAKLAVIGSACGLLGSLVLTRLLGSQLYGIKPGDPVTLAGATLLMLAIALAASYIPARRATRVDPMIALRHE
jgi:predicted permease